MSPAAPLPPERLPTLTEVIELSQTRPQVPADGGGGAMGVEADGVAAPEASANSDIAGPVPAADGRRQVVVPVEVERRAVAPSPLARPAALADEQLVARVMDDLQRQIDLMLEYRLREVLAPVLTRVADNMVREIRTELASTLRDVVARAVAQEMTRHREP